MWPDTCFRKNIPMSKSGVLFLIIDGIILSLSIFVFRNVDAALVRHDQPVCPDKGD